ncbi:TetR/AcrR family transcriptional regulator [Pseudomonas capsici]|uniref:TetR/AcrR family transcriptional regulator n=1 Tax=Pseudomonas capsici TaxID=2810614 RepID=UPI000EFF8818|nr:TetR family transcriptional regulator [Pseudomonas capsici]MCV4275798.1 TetR/AcrR family transcriptional regulator [Pseudomonas capsici]
MKVSKKQAQANRAHIVETASALFREHGYDGVGIADLMATAGFTQGGFYKHFQSKAVLMAESSACGIERSADLIAGASANGFVNVYLSREHRDNRATGCTLAALCSDAARKEDEIRSVFSAGIETQLDVLCRSSASSTLPSGDDRARHLAIMAQALGAIVMSRACPDDSPLADEILAVCRDSILKSLTPSAPRY